MSEKTNGRRLIEDYLPIEAISKEASREKSVRKGHISTLHLWWARRPLVACRAAVYAALVPASRFRPKNGPEDRRDDLTRANAAKFVEALCKYPGNPQGIAQAQHHILEAHADRLSSEMAEWKSGKSEKPGWVEEFKFDGEKVTEADITGGRAPRPRVLDMFAGGGAIPLEALRLGCDAYALDINPVAHIIELCTLVYPQKYGKPDPTIRGMTGPQGKGGQPTWGGLASEVRHWGEWVLKKVKSEIGDLYPPIPDPAFKGKREEAQVDWLKEDAISDVPRGYLIPVAYLWTRTVLCKNPTCRATVPLVKQTWLRRKKGDFVAAKIVAAKGTTRTHFEVVESASESGLGFSPGEGSKGGNATCPFCGAVADTAYVKDQGQNGNIGLQLMAVACTRPGGGPKVYVSADQLPQPEPDTEVIRKRIEMLNVRTGLSVPSEPMPRAGTLGFRIQPYGIKTWGDLFTPRQALCMLSFGVAIKDAERTMADLDSDRRTALVTMLAAMLDRLASFSSTQCVWLCIEGERTANTFGRQALPMVWDFSETAPFNEENAGWPMALDRVVPAVDNASVGASAIVTRGSAMGLPWKDGTFDLIVTDPPYYDNVPYADISDFFYVWLKRTVAHLFPTHFATALTPKKTEAIAEPMRYGGSKDAARAAYESMMAEAFCEAHRVLTRHGALVVVYPHKTTLGWATLVDSLRKAGFIVTEAWPLDTEKPGRLRAQDSAALASSLTLVARRRYRSRIGNYEEIRIELGRIVRERVETLWDMGVSGADLVIACVGAGLRALTQFARVEYANGEEMPAERFLTEVETVVLQTVLARLSREVTARGDYNLASVDPATRFYTLWRYTYRSAELEGGEAIIFANGAHVELDGPTGLSSGSRPLLEKKKGTYRLLDYTERGENQNLGMPSENGQPVPLIDAVQRTLWLLENRPGRLDEFLREAQPPLELMRLVAQALAGPALKGSAGDQTLVGSTQPEQAALGKLLSNWRSLMEQPAAPLFDGR
jgi:putative DNA methylase